MSACIHIHIAKGAPGVKLGRGDRSPAFSPCVGDSHVLLHIRCDSVGLYRFFFFTVFVVVVVAVLSIFYNSNNRPLSVLF